ncbi:MAG: carboxylesterase family protein [Firmicutes bacterium]|nr:carboxylesterase family protein [Bacillota bacterium]
MKKLFTIDDFMIAFVSALGYGYGETISKVFGLPDWLCLVICFAVGIAVEELISAIVFSKTVQKSPKKRFVTYVSILAAFLIGHTVSIIWLGESMLEHLTEEFVFAVVLPIIGFFVNLLIRRYHIMKIREVYDDGNDGFVFDLNDEDIEETNEQNKSNPVEYDVDYAIKTRTGIYVGEEYKGVNVYFGIPYAKPPVGKLRWKAPEPLPSSQKVFEAKNFGASAIQVEHKGIILKNHRQSEDCLSLNIYVGKEKTKSKKPVVVLFHNGDFTYGGSVDPLVYGENFVGSHQDIVFVSFNYRLGIFGFIDFSEVPGGDAFPDTLNLGLLDQIAALEWIKENIAAFGGDPDRITVMGFESGAVSICMLAVCKKAKGLFQKAFVFDGNPKMVYGAPTVSRDLAKKLLEETHTASMDELMRLDTETLKDASQRLWRYMSVPTYDETFVPADVYEAYHNGVAADIEFIIGIPSNESNVTRSFIGNYNYEKLLSDGLTDILNDIENSAVAEVQKYIEVQKESTSELEARSKFIDKWIALGNYRGAVKLSEGGNKVHLMYWDEKPLIENLGSGTVNAAAVLLGNEEALQLYGSVMDNDISEILQTLLHKFIKGNALKLYNNEIKGVDAFDWKKFPKALIVKDNKIFCGKIEDKLNEINDLSISL